MKTFCTIDVVEERDRAWRTINGIEEVLRLHGVAITAPLNDAILEVLHEREGLRGLLQEARLMVPDSGRSAGWRARVDGLLAEEVPRPTSQPS